MPPITPEAFAAQIATAVMGGMKDFMSKKPTQEYVVIRQTPTGPVTQQTSLPQIMAELTDQLKAQNEIKRYELNLMQQLGQVVESTKIEVEGLRTELEENRKLAQRIQKRNKKKFEDDDDDE